MQKINRDALKKAISFYSDPEMLGEGYGATILEAAAAFLEITDPEFVPSEGMVLMGSSATAYLTERNTVVLLDDDVVKKTFRAMMKELAELPPPAKP